MHMCLLAIFYILIVDGIFDLVTPLVLISSIGFYGMYSFLVNDYFDMPYDISAGKKREIHCLSRRLFIFIIFIIVTISMLHLLYLKSRPFILVYLSFYILSFLYSAPPVRFKSRGVAGIIVNVLIERMLVVLAMFTFFNHFGVDTLVFLLTSSFIHLSDIVTHQIYDYESDLKTKTKTFVVKLGLDKTLGFYRKLVCPLSLVSIVVLYTLICLKIPNALIVAFFVLPAYLFSYLFMLKGKIAREEKIFPMYLSSFFFLIHNALPPFLAFLLTLVHYEYLVLLIVAVVLQYYMLKYKIMVPILEKIVPHFDEFG